MSSLDAWANPSYCWVVICKNARVHRETNMMFGHKIHLGETDAFEPLPVSEPLWSAAMNVATSARMNQQKFCGLS